MRGASKDIQNNKGQTPVDLAKKPDICVLLGKEVEETKGQEDNDKPTFVPAYLAQPDLSKLWSMPDGSTDDVKLNQEAFALSNPNIPASTPAPRLATGTPTPSPTSKSTDSYGMTYYCFLGFGHACIDHRHCTALQMKNNKKSDDVHVVSNDKHFFLPPFS